MNLFQWIPFYRAKRRNERYMKLPVKVAEEGVVKYEALVTENATLKRQLIDIEVLKMENPVLKAEVAKLKAKIADLEMLVAEVKQKTVVSEGSDLGQSEV